MLKTPFVAGAFALFYALPVGAEIAVTDAYARSASPTAMSGAAFMMIQNSGAADRLVGVTSDIAARTELHTHLEDGDGVMRMVHVENGFDLPADDMIVLTRGGKHVMFMGLNTPLAQGDTISVTLTFEQAGEIVVDIPVDQERRDSDGMAHDHGHGHGHGDTSHGSDG